MSETTNHVHLWGEFDSRLEPWDEYYDNFRCECGAESDDGVNALPELPQVPIYLTPNVLQLNNVIDKVGDAMDALIETAEDAGVDLGPDADGIELALVDFFTDRDSREESSAAIRASEAGW